MFVDIHCHLDDEKIINNADSVVENFHKAGVGIVIDTGCNVRSSETVKAQAEKYEGVYFAAGLHPSDVKDAVFSEVENIAELAAHERCVAIGEIGLDYYWDKSYNEKQKQFFVRQIALASELKLPIVVHVRDAMGDAVEILKANKDKLNYGGVMHCYSGSAETAKELLKLGFYFSFGGTLTFKNSRLAAEVAKMLPKDRILTETDSPYLAPEPFRGTVNSPKNIPIIVKKLAEIRGETLEEMARAVYENTLRIFGKIKS